MHPLHIHHKCVHINFYTFFAGPFFIIFVVGESLYEPSLTMSALISVLKKFLYTAIVTITHYHMDAHPFLVAAVVIRCFVLIVDGLIAG